MAFKYTHELVAKGITYAQYREQLSSQLADQHLQGESAQKLLKYTQKNELRMTSIDQSLRLIPEVAEAFRGAGPIVWLVLTEGWCGDAASSVPVIARLADEFPDIITLRFYLRDENPEMMDAHLTNGGKSIPKLIMLDQSLGFIASWGPRPERLQSQMDEWKAEYENDFAGLIRRVNSWYDEDAGVSVQQEICRLMNEYSSKQQSV